MNMNMNSRKMKKLGSRDESGISQQSILCAMDRFVHAVDNMNETVMIPSRLMDMTVLDGTKTTAAPVTMTAPKSAVINQADLFSFFNMLNSVKNELIWGGQMNNMNRTVPPPTTTGSGVLQQPFLSRRNSTVSSMSLSDSEADTESCSESDSSPDSSPDSSLEYEPEVRSSVASRNFRHHLNGLYQALQQLTDSADILTDRYQQEVGGTS